MGNIIFYICSYIYENSHYSGRKGDANQFGRERYPQAHDQNTGRARTRTGDRMSARAGV